MLSIIIPTLNEEEYLPLLLESIKLQDYNDYEILVADAGSVDNTVSIAKRYGCIVIQGGPICVGRNNGARAAKGDIFLFLDSDVILKPNFLRAAITEFNKKNLGIAGFLLIPKNGKLIDRIIFYLWAILNGRLFYHAAAAIMIRRDVHNKMGGFDETIIFIEDYSYTRIAAKFSKYGFIRVPVINSTRRFNKDGRFMTYMRYALGTLHIIFIGPIKTDIFKYKFNHYKK